MIITVVLQITSQGARFFNTHSREEETSTQKIETEFLTLFTIYWTDKIIPL